MSKKKLKYYEMGEVVGIKVRRNECLQASAQSQKYVISYRNSFCTSIITEKHGHVTEVKGKGIADGPVPVATLHTVYTASFRRKSSQGMAKLF